MSVEENKKGWYKSRGLPHRDDLGLIQSVTFRLADSFPKELGNHLLSLSPSERNDPKTRRLIERVLDEGQGEPWLSHTAAAEIVVDSVRHLDANGSPVYAYVVMPNHVHLLFQPAETSDLGGLLRNLKGFTARAINNALNRSGPFWAKDYYDRFIRTPEHFVDCREYIHMNPVKAKLCSRPEEWLWSSASEPS
ncbi:transposase [bacterium]|nr:MAG: transposase [bacterium]